MKQLSHILCAASILVSSCMGGAEAQESTELPAIMRQFVENGSKVQRLPQAYGLPAFLVTKGDNRQTMYLSPDHQAVIAGMMFDKDMRSVTRTQLQSILQVTDTDQTTFEQLYSRTTGFLVGHGDTPNIVVFADPRCSECTRFWIAAAGPIKRGYLTFYVVPIGVIDRQTSTMTAAALLSAADPAAAWLTYVATKAMPPQADAGADMRGVIEQNNLAFFQYGFDRTPSFGFVTQEGTINLNNGVPENFYRNLAALQQTDKP